MPKPVLSADSHITEPAGTYVDRIDKRWRDKAPHMVRHDRLGDIFVIDGMKNPVPMGLVAAAGTKPEDIRIGGVLFDDMHRGGWDPDARLDEQDRDGVSGEILYPTVGMVLCNHTDFDYKKACFDAYNLWIAEYSGAHPERLFGIGQTAMRSPEEGIEDLRRIRELGLRGVMLPAYPQCEDYDHKSYDPFYEAAVDLGLPLSFHILTGKDDNFSAPVRGPRLNSFLSVIRGCQDVMGTLVYGGVFERHPRLKVVCVEADAGWVPHYTYRMDHAFTRHRHWMAPDVELSKLPSEYFRRQCFISGDPDETAAPHIIDHVGADCFMWATDYPHPDHPGSWVKALERFVAPLSEKTRTRVLGENVARVYGLD